MVKMCLPDREGDRESRENSSQSHQATGRPADHHERSVGCGEKKEKGVSTLRFEYVILSAAIHSLRSYISCFTDKIDIQTTSSRHSEWLIDNGNLGTTVPGTSTAPWSVTSAV